jgi:hypothetical protein
LQTAEADATDISDHFSAAPFADLEQGITNDIGYVEDLLKNPLDISTVLTDIQDDATAFFGGSAADPGALWGPFLPAGGAADTLYQSLDAIVNSTGTGAFGPGILSVNHDQLFTLTQELVLPSLFTDPNTETRFPAWPTSDRARPTRAAWRQISARF